MGRPRAYAEPRVATAIRLPLSLRDQLQEEAAGRDVSVNYLVTRAVSDYLRHLAEPSPPAGSDTDVPRKKHRTTKKGNRDRR